MASEMAGGGGRLQPARVLTPWSQGRLGQGRARRRNMGMGALARKGLRRSGAAWSRGHAQRGRSARRQRGETAPAGAQVRRRRAPVGAWGGARVAGPGVAGRTEEEAGLPPQAAQAPRAPQDRA